MGLTRRLSFTNYNISIMGSCDNMPWASIKMFFAFAAICAVGCVIIWGGHSWASLDGVGHKIGGSLVIIVGGVTAFVGLCGMGAAYVSAKHEANAKAEAVQPGSGPDQKDPASTQLPAHQLVQQPAPQPTERHESRRLFVAPTVGERLALTGSVETKKLALFFNKRTKSRLRKIALNPGSENALTDCVETQKLLSWTTMGILLSVIVFTLTMVLRRFQKPTRPRWN